ncbi:MAG: ABC transporter [Myxococcales bacterium]
MTDDIRKHLSEAGSSLPTTALGRLGRTARAAWSVGRSLRGGDPDQQAILDAVARVGQLKGIAMKAAQIMSYVDVALPDELRSALAVLQTWSQPMPVEEVRGILRAALGERAAPLLGTLEPVPIAAASIGQVHRASLASGPVVVKVRYPHIEDAIRADFRPAAAGARLASLMVPGARVDDFIGEARSRFLEECDYAHEAQAQQRFHALLRGHPVLEVPPVVPDLCATNVLTMAFMEGVHLDTWLATDPSPETRDRVGVALFDFYVGSLFRHGLYNCDPHPGNYLFKDDGRVAVLDYGCTRAFEPPFVAALARLTRAVHADEPALLHRACLDVGLVQEGRRYDAATARKLLRAFYGPMLRDAHQAIDLGEATSMAEMMKSKRELLRLTLPGELLFLFRIRFGLMSVLARIGARANWHRLERTIIDESGL